MLYSKGIMLIALMLASVLGRTETIMDIRMLKDISVNDFTNTLTVSQIDELKYKLTQLNNEKGSQIAVLIIETLDGKSIEQVSIDYAEAMGVGRKGISDGVLLLIAKNDRQIRIEVGDGLEGAIPDIAAGRIINEYIVPYFRSGDFYVGIDAGVNVLIRLINGEELPPPYIPEIRDYEKEIAQIFIGIFGFIIALFLVTIKKNKIFVPIALGLIIFSWWYGGWFSGVLIAFMFVVLKILYTVGNKRGWFDGASYSSGYSSYSNSGSTSYSSSSYGSSSSSSSSSSGGGYSGGGGGFSGGGASGSW